MGDKYWLFDKTEIKILIRDVLKGSDKNVKSLLLVKYTLPFELPFTDQSKMLFNYNSHKIALMSKKIKIKEQFDEDLSLDSNITEVEVAVLSYKYIERRAIDKKRDEVITLTMEFINHIITSLMVKFNPGNIRRISRQDLLPLIPVKFVRNINFKEESIEDFGVENFHYNIPYEMSNLTSDELDELVEFSNRKAENPFVESISYMRESQEQIKKGMYQYGIIGLQTSIEMFMYVLLKQILHIKENKSPEKISSVLQSGYKNIINAHLKKHFKDENFIFELSGVENKKNILNGYQSGLYKLRNKIVHEGKRCTEAEALEAEENTYEMMKKVIKAINSSKLKGYAFDGQEMLY